MWFVRKKCPWSVATMSVILPSLKLDRHGEDVGVRKRAGDKQVGIFDTYRIISIIDHYYLNVGAGYELAYWDSFELVAPGD